MNISTETLISVAQAAARLSVSRNTVKRHIPTVRVGGRVLVRISDVDAKIAEGSSNGAL